MATELKLAPKEHQVADPIRTPGPYPDAVAEIDEKLKADPKNADLWMQRGLALAGGFYMREAVEAYSRAIELDPFKGILYRHRGHRHISCWEFEEAAADFVMASRLIPDNWDVWYHLGLSYFLLGRYEDAAVAINAAMHFPIPLKQMISVLLLTGAGAPTCVLGAKRMLQLC